MISEDDILQAIDKLYTKREKAISREKTRLKNSLRREFPYGKSADIELFWSKFATNYRPREKFSPRQMCFLDKHDWLKVDGIGHKSIPFVIEALKDLRESNDDKT